MISVLAKESVVWETSSRFCMSVDYGMTIGCTSRVGTKVGNRRLLVIGDWILDKDK